MAYPLRKLPKIPTNFTQAVFSLLKRTAFQQYPPLREPSQPQKKEPKFVDAAKAFEVLKSNNTVYVQAAAATPNLLLKAMTEYGKASNLKNIKVCHMHTEGPALYNAPEMEGLFRSRSFFIGGNCRKAIAEGRSDCIPIFLSEIPLLFYKRIIEPDIALLNLSPPDQHGYCSMGTSVDCARAGAMYAKKVIAQINDKMPRTFGDAIIHLSNVDYAVKCSEPLPTAKSLKLDDISLKIGKSIAEKLIEDGSTLQVGIGGIPDAVLQSLTGHKHLGVHSEMFADGIIDLVKKGCITNKHKTMHKGRMVVSFIMGTEKCYEYANNNPFIEMLAVDYVNDTRIIAKQNKMVAINSCIEVDLTGQVSSDSIGTRFFSGFGGQVDFIRGASQSEDGQGKPIIAFISTTKGKSKIVPLLKPGAGVVTSRAHVHYVATEYGIANLFGKTVRQRAYELINIAHPDHRAELEKAAFERLKVKPSKD